MSAISNVLTGFRLIAGEKLNEIISAVNNLTGNGTAGAVSASTLTAANTVTTGTETATPQLVSAAGATQGAATAITKSLAIITVCTASARGVKLPAAATGLMVRVFSLCTQGTKVYPASGDKIGAAATNIAVVLAGFKANIYASKDAVTWAVLKGA